MPNLSEMVLEERDALRRGFGVRVTRSTLMVRQLQGWPRPTLTMDAIHPHVQPALDQV